MIFLVRRKFAADRLRETDGFLNRQQCSQKTSRLGIRNIRREPTNSWHLELASASVVVHESAFLPSQVID
jgi:hypothetical protein